MGLYTVTRYHDISAGHRVLGHENKCSHLHGHNYRIHFTIAAEAGLDNLGRVMDFGIIKARLCSWLENVWDHKMLLSYNDPFLQTLRELDPNGVVGVKFNPTAENMAAYLVDTVAPRVLQGTGTKLIQCTVEETRKCSATYAAYLDREERVQPSVSLTVDIDRVVESITKQEKSGE